MGESNKVKRHFPTIVSGACLNFKYQFTDLVCDVWSGLTNISLHLPHDSNVLVAIQQAVLVVPGAISAPRVRLVRLQTSIAEDNDQALAVSVRGGDRDMLFSNELW